MVKKLVVSTALAALLAGTAAFAAAPLVREEQRDVDLSALQVTDKLQ